MTPKRPLTIRFLAVALLPLGAGSLDAATTAYNNLINASNPLLHLGLDETSGTAAADIGNDATPNPGTYGGVVTLGQASAGVNLNTSIVQNGSSNGTSVTIPGSTTFDAIGTGDFTVELWFNASTVTVREDLFTFKGGSGDLGIHLSSQTAGLISVYNQGFVISSTTAISVNTWYHLALVRAAGTSTLFLNGAFAGSGADTKNINTSVSPILLGSNTGGAIPYSGRLDELAFYNSALRQATLQSHIAAAVPEPSMALLAGLGAFAGFRRRRGN